MEKVIKKKKEEGKSSIINFFSNPLVGFVGSTASVIALVFYITSSIYGKPRKELTFYGNPVKTSIVKAGRSSALGIVWNDEKLASDVTASQIAIWNNGKRTIERNDILEDIVIFTQPKTRIIESKILKTSRDVIDLVLDENNLKDGYLSVSWRILEQNDGGVVQLIYAGNEDVKISIKGIIKEQPKIRQIEYASKIKSPLEQMNENAKQNKILAFFLLAIAISYSLMPIWMARAKSKRKERLKKKLGLLDPEKDKGEIEFLETRIADFEGLKGLTAGIPGSPYILIVVIAGIILTWAASIYYFLISPVPGPPFGF